MKELMPDITIHMAFDGQQAVDRLQKEMYDIVLMDIQMPVMDGMTATKKLYADCPNLQRA